MQEWGEKLAKVIDVIMRLQDQVTRPLTRIRNQLEQTARLYQRVGREVSKVGKDISGIGNAMMPVSAAIVGVGAACVKTFADFDHTITGAGIKAGATAEELEGMRKVASEIGRDFPITANEAAQAMDRLAAGGFDAKQSMGALPGIVTAAVASGEDLATTSDVITSALSIWNMKTGDVNKNTAHVADVIQMAANKSKLGMQDFGLAMQYAGAPAAALGVDIEALGAAMGIMANNGIEASTIGTSLRATMSRLAAPPKEARNAIAQLGLQINDAKGHFVGLESIVSQLRNTTKGMNETQQIAIMKAIAGEDAYSGLLSLVRTSPEEYKAMEDAIRNADGSSQKAYETMKGTAKGAFMSLQGSVESLAISMGTLLAPTVGEVAGHIKAAADWIAGLDDNQKMMIINVAKGVLAFTAFNLATGKVVQIGGGLVRLYGDIGAAAHGMSIKNKLLQYSVRGVVRLFPLVRSGIMAAVRAMASAAIAGGPVMWVIMAIAGLAYLIYANWSTLGPMFKGFWDEAVNTFTWAYNGISNFIGNIIAVLGSLIDYVAGAFTSAWSAAWSAIVSVFSSIFSEAEGVCTSIMGGIKAAINAVITGINGISVDIPDWVPGVGGNHFGLNIPMLYTGTNNWRGGPAVINDRGAEVVDLPSGSRVIPHEQSLSQAYRHGEMAGSNGGNKISVNIVNPQINSQGDIKELAKKVAEEIYYQMQKHAVNLNEGAI